MELTYPPKNPSSPPRDIPNPIAAFKDSFPVPNVRHDAEIAKRKSCGMQIIPIQSLRQPKRFLARDLSCGRVLRILYDRAISNRKYVSQMREEFAVGAVGIDEHAEAVVRHDAANLWVARNVPLCALGVGHRGLEYDFFRREPQDCAEGFLDEGIHHESSRDAAVSESAAENENFENGRKAGIPRRPNAHPDS